MRKIKRKQIDFGGTYQQYIRGDGELDNFPDIPEQTIANDGDLAINVESTELMSFGANQSEDTSLSFKAGVGIALQGNSQDNSITISSESNHVVTEKNTLVRGQQGRTVYYYYVKCNLNNNILKIANLSDFASKSQIYDTPNTYIWTKAANETGVYLGFCKLKGTEGSFVLKLDIINSVTNKTETHYIGMIGDAPYDSTFTFVSTCTWNIVIKINVPAHTLLAYFEVPDDFVGNVQLTPIRRNISSGYEVSAFEHGIETDTIDYLWGTPIEGGTQTLNVITSPLLYDDPVTSPLTDQRYLRQPSGNYNVNVIGDFGTLAVNSKISDSIINDYYLHTVEKKLEDHINQYNALLQLTGTKSALYTLLGLPEPTSLDAGRVLGVNSNGEYELIPLQ